MVSHLKFVEMIKTAIAKKPVYKPMTEQGFKAIEGCAKFIPGLEQMTDYMPTREFAIRNYKDMLGDFILESNFWETCAPDCFYSLHLLDENFTDELKEIMDYYYYEDFVVDQDNLP